MRLADTRISVLPWAATTSRLSDEQVAEDAVDYPATRDFMRAVDGPTDAYVANQLAAVAVFGNLLNRLGQLLTDWSPVYGAKTIDLCNGADPVRYGGDDVSARSLYVDSGLPDQAAVFAGDRLQAT